MHLPDKHNNDPITALHLFTTNMPNEHAIHLHVETEYLPQQSSPERGQFAFAYTITLRNDGDDTVQLLSRRWEIADANGQLRIVEGEGVVGEQPILSPGEQYTYSSGAVLATKTGSMEGHYIFRDSEQQTFTVTIPVFGLVHPGSLQ